MILLIIVTSDLYIMREREREGRREGGREEGYCTMHSHICSAPPCLRFIGKLSNLLVKRIYLQIVTAENFGFKKQYMYMSNNEFLRYPRIISFYVANTSV